MYLAILGGMFDFIPEFFWKIIISLVGAIYQLVNYTYQVFLFLAETNIFDQSIYHSLTDKIYVILGVVMLFIIAYNFLTLVIDPDKNEKGATVEKILKNIVTSFILIIICPSLFNFAFRVQNSILTTNGGIIGNFFSGSFGGASGEDTIKSGGRRMAVNTFKAFFVPVDENYSLTSKSSNRSYKLPNGTTINCSSNCTLEQAEQAALELGSFAPFKAFAMNIVKDEVDFSWLIALIAGGYLVYVIVSFCFDLAVRACKLAFYQIIAPIAISCRILPNQDDIFKKWFKAVTKTFLAVFIRIIIMNLGVFLISAFMNSDFFSGCDDCSFGVKLIGYAFIILGIVTFIKQAPKLVDDIFGLGEDISLGIKDKLKNASVFTAGAAIGAGATSMVRNAGHAVKNFKEAKGTGAKAAALGRGVLSTFAGAGSGAYHGFRQGANASSFGEMASSASKSANESTENRTAREARRERYHAANQGPIRGHLSDMAADIKDWATGGAEQYEGIIKVADEFKKAQDDMHSEAEKVMNKFKTNTGIISSMVGKDGKTLFKGSDAQEIMDIFTNEYKGMSLAAIEADVNRLKGVTDFASMVNKQQFTKADGTFDQDGYNAAVEQKAREHAQQVALRESLYNQLWKQSRLKVEDAAMGNITIAGIEAKDLAATKAKSQEFSELYKSHGAHVEDPITKKEHKGEVHTAHDIDDVAGAYQNVGARARSESARARQQAQARKGDNK